MIINYDLLVNDTPGHFAIHISGRAQLFHRHPPSPFSCRGDRRSFRPPRRIGIISAPRGTEVTRASGAISSRAGVLRDRSRINPDLRIPVNAVLTPRSPRLHACGIGNPGIDRLNGLPVSIARFGTDDNVSENPYPCALDAVRFLSRHGRVTRRAAVIGAI